MTPQTPWVLRKFHFDFELTQFPVIFSRLEGSIFRIGGLLANADEKRTGTTGRGWTVKQHLGHLTDLEELWWKRLDDFAKGKAELTAADMGNEKTEKADHNAMPLQELVRQFTLERQRLLETIFAFDGDYLSKTALHPRLKVPMRLIDSLYFAAEHDDHHIAALTTLLRTPAG